MAILYVLLTFTLFFCIFTLYFVLYFISIYMSEIKTVIFFNQMQIIHTSSIESKDKYGAGNECKPP